MAEGVPTERELQALKVIWQLGRATIREICDAINQRGEELAYTTVLSLLQVMEQKGLVGHTASGKVYSYFAKVQRDLVYRRLAGGFLDRVFDGAMDEYLVHALEGKKLSADELNRLEELIAQAKHEAHARQQRRRKGGKDETQ
ncbi:MAG: BlaI/MecI/CopY family transcriptional regulator [Pirellulales bacterium]